MDMLLSFLIAIAVIFTTLVVSFTLTTVLIILLGGTLDDFDT